MTTKDSSKGTRLLPKRVEKVHFRGFTSSRPTPQESQPQSTLAANSDSLWIFPHLENKWITIQMEDLTQTDSSKQWHSSHTSSYLAIDWITVGKPRGDFSFLLKLLLRSCRLTHTAPRSLQFFMTTAVQKSILLSQSVVLTSRFSLNSENMKFIRSSSSHSGGRLVSADVDIYTTYVETSAMTNLFINEQSGS